MNRRAELNAWIGVFVLQQAARLANWPGPIEAQINLSVGDSSATQNHPRIEKREMRLLDQSRNVPAVQIGLSHRSQIRLMGSVSMLA
jgi:hypothetical protein